MRFWITKNSELPVRDQLASQVILAVLSEELPPGHKLPSTRSVARLYRIHPNTVGSAYQRLEEEGWLELRRGSGLYVSARHAGVADANCLDRMLAEMLNGARQLGHEPEAVLRRLEWMLRPKYAKSISVFEPDPAMREILLAEIRQQLNVPVEIVGLSTSSGVPSTGDALIAALPTRESLLRKQVKEGRILVLRVHSIREALSGQVRPSASAILAIVSGSSEFRLWARAVLLAVGIEPECLCDLDTAFPDWKERASASTLVITDIVAAPQLALNIPCKVFRIISDASIAEIARICGISVTPP